jgi:hypothetical protein
MAMMACTSGSYFQLHIHHPLVNSLNAGGYLAGKVTLYKRVSNTRLKMMSRYLFMAMMAWYQRCHRRRARIPFIHAVSSVCSTSTYTWRRGHQCVHQHTNLCTFVQYVTYIYVNDQTTRVGGARPPPFITFTITSKVAVYAPAELADTLTLFHL